jgi:hypothetical protein
MSQTRTDRAASWLPVMIRLNAIGYLLFFVPDLTLASTPHVSGLPPLLTRLFDWGGGGPNDQAIAVMFACVYIVWALFLFGSARAPLANRHARHGRGPGRRTPAPGGCGGARIAHHCAVGGLLAAGPAQQRPVNAGGTTLGMVE